MKTTLLTLAAVLALGAAAGCDRDAGERASQAVDKRPDSAAAGGTAAQSNTPTTPANIGQPQTQAEKREGANPVQGQVDPKQREQHRDFQQRGDRSGPTGPDTQPKTGG